jgi:hypothetical protein
LRFVSSSNHVYNEYFVLTLIFSISNFVMLLAALAIFAVAVDLLLINYIEFHVIEASFSDP